MSHMSNIGAKMGLDSEVADSMIIQTVLGAAIMAKESGDSLDTLCSNVTSKNGVTEASLLSFNTNGLYDIIEKAMLANIKRSQELTYNKIYARCYIMNKLIELSSFIITVVFNLYAFIIMLRVFLQMVKADFYNPVCQSIMRYTNLFIIPARKLLPGIFGIDIASILIAYLVLLFKNILIHVFISSSFPSLMILVFTILDLIKLCVQMYIYLVIIRVVMSWFGHNQQYNPMSALLIKVTQPLFNLVYRLLKPKQGGLDFAPIIILLCLFSLQILLS